MARGGVDHTWSHRLYSNTVSPLVDKPCYTIRNLVIDKEYVVDFTHIWPFCYDPTYVTPLNIVVKDTDETMMDMIVKHDTLRGVHFFDLSKTTQRDVEEGDFDTLQNSGPTNCFETSIWLSASG